VTADSALLRTSLPLPPVAQGKVRDVYDAGDDRLLIVTTDRISAFDVVMPQGIPGKGAVLTQITAWWLERLSAAEPHHLISTRTDEICDVLPGLTAHRGEIAGRSMLVRRTEPIAIECVVRGYVSGSAWKEYARHGTLATEPLPPGLSESARLEAPIFSPATKAERGLHDENITYDEVASRLGRTLARELRNRSLSLYSQGSEVARRADIIVADTKFEFGVARNGELLLIDEVLTPDSSRFWPAEHYAPGRGQPSLDKQPLRDWLESLGAAWDKTPPGPDLPADVVRATAERYRDVFRRLTGRDPEELA